jgi:hypothetical protein
MNRLDELKGTAKHLLYLLQLVFSVIFITTFGTVVLYISDSNFIIIMFGILLSILSDIVLILLSIKYFNICTKMGEV